MDLNVEPAMFSIFRGRSTAALQAALARAEDYLQEYGGYPSTGMTNTKGVLQYLLAQTQEDKHKAITSFKDVLKQDPDNLNGWESRRFAFADTGLDEDVEKCDLELRPGRQPGADSPGLHHGQVPRRPRLSPLDSGRLEPA